MNWQIPTLFGQTKTVLERVQETTLPGTAVPQSSIERPESGVTYWFPEQASTFAQGVDDLYMFIFWVSAVFFLAIVVAMVYLVFKYRRKGKEIVVEPSSSHNTNLEIAWSVLPSILLVPMFWWGATGYFDSRIPRDDAEEILVTASRYNWLFTYPDGDSSSELHLVRDRPVTLKMQSNDVLHSMYVPAFRQKMDIVPGRYTYAYIVPTKTGQFRLACTEYCGEGHSKMRTLAEVHIDDNDRKQNTQWIKAEHPPWENGARIYKIHCSGCHRIDGQAATGPALNLTWNREGETITGEKFKADDNYIQESIWYPGAKVIKGYGPVSKMNSFKGILNQEDISHVIAYLKYLQDPSLAASSEPASTEEAATSDEESVEADNEKVSADDETDSDA
jgi:cytochrome c oxidase subunit 2